MCRCLALINDVTRGSSGPTVQSSHNDSLNSAGTFIRTLIPAVPCAYREVNNQSCRNDGIKQDAKAKAIVQPNIEND
jgi:hypothetical protein